MAYLSCELPPFLVLGAGAAILVLEQVFQLGEASFVLSLFLMAVGILCRTFIRVLSWMVISISCWMVISISCWTVISILCWMVISILCFVRNRAHRLQVLGGSYSGSEEAYHLQNALVVDNHQMNSNGQKTRQAIVITSILLGLFCLQLTLTDFVFANSQYEHLRKIAWCLLLVPIPMVIWFCPKMLHTPGFVSQKLSCE